MHLNVYCSPTYECLYKKYCEQHKKNEIEAITEQVYHFGQTPINLFKKPHPCREEMQKTNFFRKLFYFNEKNDILMKKTAKLEQKQGRAYAIFYLNNRVIVIKAKNSQFFISKFRVKDPKDPPVFYAEYLIKNYKHYLNTH